MTDRKRELVPDSWRLVRERTKSADHWTVLGRMVLCSSSSKLVFCAQSAGIVQKSVATVKDFDRLFFVLFF